MNSELNNAISWCRDYAAQYQENFVIASRWLLPPEKRDEYFALYAFARGADDLADEGVSASDGTCDDSTSTPASRYEALNKWQAELDTIYSDGNPSHPAFIALRPVIQRYAIEKGLFDRMLEAFRRDQAVSRYETWQDVRAYTRGSADPVGRWVLRLYGYRSAALDRWSDSICTALQLVNFIQDVREDLEKRDRIYLPLDEMHEFGVTDEMLTEAPTPEPLRRLLRFQAGRAERIFADGRSLLDQVKPELKKQLILFHGGGRVALQAVRRAHYDVTSQHRRPSKFDQIALALRALRGKPL